MNRKSTPLGVTYLSLAIASIFAMSASAAAQEIAKPGDVAQANTGVSAESGDAKIEQVTVTARRRAELLKDVPTAVTALSAAALADLNVQSLADLDGHVPDLTVYAARGSNTTVTTFIRGIGQADPTWGTDPGVGIYLDDVYIARPQGALLDVFDVQRIEVLRGPQGTLYGMNTIGGAVKYVSKPLSTKTEGSVEVGYGSYSQENIKASAGTASDDGVWRGKIALASLHHDGYGHNLDGGEPVSNQNTNAGRVSVGYFPTNTPLTVQLSVDDTRDNSNERGFQRMAQNAFDPAKTPAETSRYDINSAMPDVNYTHSSGAALTAAYDLNDVWTLKAIASRRHSDTQTTIDFDGLRAPIADVNGDYHDSQSTEELQVVYQGKAGTSGVVGLYRLEGTAGGHIYNDFLGLLFGDSAGAVDTTNTALYTDWSFKLAPRWNLSAGLRYTKEEKHAVVDNQSFSNGTFTVPIATSANFDKTLSTNNLAPKIALEFEATDSTNVYTSLARGFKAGGFNIRANTAAVPASSHPYLDEEVTTLEIGSKSSFDDGRLQLNAALFDSKYKNMQLSVFTSYTQANGTQGFFGDFTNAGESRIAGLEIETIWKPTRNWNISGNLSNLYTHYYQYLSGGVNVADQQKFSNAPRVQAGLNVEYIARPSFGGTLRSRIGYTYQSKVYPTTDLSEAIAQDSYGLLGAGIMWERDAHWTFSLQGSNLTDRYYRTDGYNIPALHILDAYYGPPRLITATVGYKF